MAPEAPPPAPNARRQLGEIVRLLNRLLPESPPQAPNARRLFLGSCVALVATSVAFATVGAVMFSLKTEFALTNAQVGWIGGAALWGFAVSQLVFSPFCDTLGMRFLLRLAFAGHLAGTLIMIFGGSFAGLFAGALLIAMANGLVEAACNPLVAALYPGDKTVKLNQFHVWFPGGIVLGGLAAYGLDSAARGLDSATVGDWRLKLALVLLPTLAYGVLLLSQRFPRTEGVRSGVSMGEMFKAALTTPLMLLLLACMALTASVELGPTRWLPAILEAAGMPGILVLAYVGAIMAVLRYFAGPVVRRFSPTGILAASAVLSGLGLLWLGAGVRAGATLAAATVFAVGVCYFWPTMLGLVSERVPKSGALGLGLMGTVGMAVVGLATAPLMGRVADRRVAEALDEDAVVATLQEAQGVLEARALDVPVSGSGDDAMAALAEVTAVLAGGGPGAQTSPADAANALRTVARDAAPSAAAARAEELLGPADLEGGLLSLRWLAPFCAVLAVVFGVLWRRDRRRLVPAA